MVSKDTLQQAMKDAKSLSEEHGGKAVVTAWGYDALRFFWKGPGKGCSGTIVGWGLDGPKVQVDFDEDNKPPVGSFFPGGSHESGRWGEGRTWNFRTKTAP